MKLTRQVTSTRLALDVTLTRQSVKEILFGNCSITDNMNDDRSIPSLFPWNQEGSWRRDVSIGVSEKIKTCV